MLQVSLGLLSTAVIALGLTEVPLEGQEGADSSYPAPSYPPMEALKTVEDVMPYARVAARNESGFLGLGFGAVRPGETAILVTSTTDPESEIYIEAIMKAMRERDVTPIRMPEYEIMDVTREEARALEEALVEIQGPADSSRGWSEGCNLFQNNMEWLKETRKDLYDLCEPPDLVANLPPELRDVYAKMRVKGREIPERLNAYLDEHPDVRGVFYGRGGPIRFAFRPQERWLGVFRYDNPFNVIPEGADELGFPADVLMLSEELTMEPGTATEKVTVTDPEGTDVWWEMTEEQAQRWIKGHYRRGHMFLYATQAYGAYAQSTVNFPSLDPEWIPLEPTVKLHGKVVAHASHAGFYPKMTNIWEDGYLAEVQGGGTYGELLRTAMKMPGINEKVYPLRDDPGYFYHWETAFGTNPKALRPDVTRERVSAERERDGVIHWGLGIQHFHDEGVMHATSPPSLAEFGKKERLPSRHGIHMHTYFNTVTYHIRGVDRKIVVVDKGRSTALDSPEVRALASRYGDPDVLLATDWIPEIPGVNAPGNYDEFAADPWPHDKKVMQQILAGEYDKYNPDVRYQPDQ